MDLSPLSPSPSPFPCPLPQSTFPFPDAALPSSKAQLIYRLLLFSQTLHAYSHALLLASSLSSPPKQSTHPPNAATILQKLFCPLSLSQSFQRNPKAKGIHQQLRLSLSPSALTDALPLDRATPYFDVHCSKNLAEEEEREREREREENIQASQSVEQRETQRQRKRISSKKKSSH